MIDPFLENIYIAYRVFSRLSFLVLSHTLYRTTLLPEHDLAAILSHVEERRVAKDYTLRYARRLYQVARAGVRPGLRGG